MTLGSSLVYSPEQRVILGGAYGGRLFSHSDPSGLRSSRTPQLWGGRRRSFFCAATCASAAATPPAPSMQSSSDRRRGSSSSTAAVGPASVLASQTPSSPAAAASVLASQTPSSAASGAASRGAPCQALSALAAGAGEDSPVAILINGASGKMGRAVAEAALEAGVPLVPYGITGPGLPSETLTFAAPPSSGAAPEEVSLEVVPAEERDAVLDKALQQWPGLIIVDYTLPSAVNDNAEWYCKRRQPFVMGTTGGDRAKLMQDVEESKVYSVIAAQMGKQLVAFIAAMENLARDSPGAFSGYKLKVVESHQSTKVDTSGTAKDVVSIFQRLGMDFSFDQIEKVREPGEQVSRMGVPEEFLNAHAFHTYRFTSPDNSVSFEFQHNVCGRSVYAQGAVDAVLFLHQQIQAKAPKTLYNMVDVLKAGSMR